MSAGPQFPFAVQDDWDAAGPKPQAPATAATVDTWDPSGPGAGKPPSGAAPPAASPASTGGVASTLRGAWDKFVAKPAQAASDWLTGSHSLAAESGRGAARHAALLDTLKRDNPQWASEKTIFGQPLEPTPEGESPEQVANAAPPAPDEAQLWQRAKAHAAMASLIAKMPDPAGYVASHRAQLVARGYDPDVLGSSFSAVAPHEATLGEQLQQPLVKPSPLTEEALRNRPISRAVVNTASGLTSPENLGLAAATAGYGAYADVLGTALTRAGLEPGLAAGLVASAPKLASLGFSAQQLANAAKLSPQFVAALRRGDYRQAQYLGAEALIGAALGTAGALYGRGAKQPYLARDVETEAAAPAAATTAEGGMQSLAALPTIPASAGALPPGPILGTPQNPREGATGAITAQRQLERGIATGAGQPQPPEPLARIIHQPPPPAGSISRGFHGEPLALPPAPLPGNARFVAGERGVADKRTPEGPAAQPALPGRPGQPGLPARPEPPALPPGPASGTPRNPRLMGPSPEGRGNGEGSVAAATPPEPIVPATGGHATPPEGATAPLGRPLAAVTGARAPVKLPTGELPAQYAVVDAASLVPSHHPVSFAPTPGYPAGVQERDYQRSQAAQARVAEQAQAIEPRYLLTNNPDAVNGPPVVTPQGVVLGGNSRTMSLQRAYGAGGAANYRRALLQAAPSFGISPEAVASMKSPVLVRVVVPEAVPRDTRGLASLASDLNRSQTGSLGDAELAVARGRVLRPDTLARIGSMAADLGEGATVSDLLSERPREVVEALSSDGAIAPRERAQFQDPRTGALTQRGRDFVTKALVGSALPDAELVDAAPAAVLQKIARVAPQLARLQGAEPGWDLTGPLSEAVQLVTEARGRRMPLSDLLAQQGLFGQGGASERGQLLAEALATATPKQWQKLIEDYAAEADQNPRGQMLMPGMEAPEPSSALRAAPVAHARRGPKFGKNELVPIANEIESRPLEGGAAFMPLPGGTGGVLYLDRNLWHRFSDLMSAALGEDMEDSGALLLTPLHEGALLAQASKHGLAVPTELWTAIGRSPHGLVVVEHGNPDTPDARAEDVLHWWQAAADHGDPGRAVSLEASRSLLRNIPGASAFGKLYGPRAQALVASGAPVDAVQRMLGAEVGARLLGRRYGELSISPAYGAGLRRWYWDKIMERWGRHGIERANAGRGPTGPELAALAGGDGEQEPGGASQGRYIAHRRTEADAAPGIAAGLSGRGARTNAGGSTTYGKLAGGLVEPERGPLAGLVRAYDRAIGKATGSKAARWLDRATSIYGGNSPEARQALRQYGGELAWRDLQAWRTAHDLYGDIFDALGPAWKKNEPRLVRIQHAIERPGEVSLTPGEKKVRDAAVRLADEFAAKEVAAGFLRPNALRRGNETVSLDALSPRERDELSAALAQWRQIEHDPAAVPRDRLLPLTRKWLEGGVSGTEEPYWPHRYVDEGGKPLVEPKPGAKMAPRPSNLKQRTFRTLQAAEAAGLHPDPDLVRTLIHRQRESNRALAASHLLQRLGALGPEEFLPDAETARGRPKAEPGFVLAKDIPALRGQLRASEMGGPQPQVSENLARSIEHVLGNPKRSNRAEKWAHRLWQAERALQFWNLTKHAANIASISAWRAATEGTRDLALGRPRAAAGEFQAMLGPGNIWALAEAANKGGEWYDRAVRAGAVRPQIGAAGSFGTTEAGSEDGRLEEAKGNIFGRSAAAKLKHRGLQLVNLPHTVTFSLVDAAYRLALFRHLVEHEGLSDPAAADEVNAVLVDYGDRAHGGAGGVGNFVVWTWPWLKGAMKSLGRGWLRNPLAAAAVIASTIGGEEYLNRLRTGHSMAENPPGEQNRYYAGDSTDGLPQYRQARPAWMLPLELAEEPKSFGYNRLGPGVRFGVSAASNEQNPPMAVGPFWGGANARRANDWHVVSAAPEAAAEAEHPSKKWLDYMRLAQYQLLGGPVQDIGDAASGQRSWMDLVAPVTTHSENPYRALYGDVKAAEALDSQMKRERASGASRDEVDAEWGPSLTTTFDRAEGDRRRAFDLYQRLTPTKNADQTLRYLRLDSRTLRSLERRHSYAPAPQP